MKLAQHKGNKSKHNDIFATKSSCNTTKLAKHDRNKPLHNKISTTQQKKIPNKVKLAQHNGKKAATQRKQATTQYN